jgi:hypothetical protein
MFLHLILVQSIEQNNMYNHTCEICLNSPLPMASIDTSMDPHFSAIKKK